MIFAGPPSKLLIFSLMRDSHYVDGTHLTDTDIPQVDPDTVALSFENAAITDEGIRTLPDLPKLRCLDLDSTRITDRAMSTISQYTSLEELWIEDTAVTDFGISALYGLKSLQFISISYCDVSDTGIDRLKKEIPGVSVLI